MSADFQVASIDIIPVRLPLIEPFIVSYGEFPDTLSVLVKVTSRGGAVGWGEATPDPNVTGETWRGVTEALRHELAPALIGLDARNLDAAHQAMNQRIEGAPAAKAALDIALHDLIGHAYGCPVWALLGGKAKPHLTISRVVSMRAPDVMARDAANHVDDGFHTIKIKVGDRDHPSLDAARIRAVREAIGDRIGLKVDVNQGWRNAGTAIAAIRASIASVPDYYEQPVAWWDLEGLADVRRQTGAMIMADEACHGPRDMLRIVQLRAADLVNIKLMKSGGIRPAMTINAIAESAGVAAQIGTMVESSIASAAGLHLAIALGNVRTVEMGGPLMLARDIGNAATWYDRDTIDVPDLPGLGIHVSEDEVDRIQDARYTIK